jgi:hypothetical protein
MWKRPDLVHSLIATIASTIPAVITWIIVVAFYAMNSAPIELWSTKSRHSEVLRRAFAMKQGSFG